MFICATASVLDCFLYFLLLRTILFLSVLSYIWCFCLVFLHWVFSFSHSIPPFTWILPICLISNYCDFSCINSTYLLLPSILWSVKQIIFNPLHILAPKSQCFWFLLLKEGFGIAWGKCGKSVGCFMIREEPPSSNN